MTGPATPGGAKAGTPSGGAKAGGAEKGSGAATAAGDMNLAGGAAGAIAGRSFAAGVLSDSMALIGARFADFAPGARWPGERSRNMLSRLSELPRDKGARSENQTADPPAAKTETADRTRTALRVAGTTIAYSIGKMTRSNSLTINLP